MVPRIKLSRFIKVIHRDGLAADRLVWTQLKTFGNTEKEFNPNFQTYLLCMDINFVDV